MSGATSYNVYRLIGTGGPVSGSLYKVGVMGTTFTDTNVAYGYDMVALIAGITGALGPDGLQREAFQNRSGFRGSTGVFRFRADGVNERGLAVMEVGAGGALTVVSPAASTFQTQAF